MPAGRPSLATPETKDAILLRLAVGEPLARICADPDMPHYATVRRWEDEDEEFRALSTRARIDGTHYMADECLDIADDPSLEPADKKVRIDTRIRLIGKWNAKAYGDKLDVTSEGKAVAGLAVAFVKPGEQTPDSD